MKIIHKKRITEANIQAELYCACKAVGLRCYLEYKVDNCRFDAVIYDDQDNIIAIIEIKSYSTKRLPRNNTKQLSRYRQYGVPVYLITRIDAINEVLSKIIKSKD